jgi:hypothetical protein
MHFITNVSLLVQCCSESHLELAIPHFLPKQVNQIFSKGNSLPSANNLHMVESLFENIKSNVHIGPDVSLGADSHFIG